ncbi:MAG: hypothetical protein AAGF28_06965 [Pseudomonadota bacterium]
MRPKEIDRAKAIADGLDSHSKNVTHLAGLSSAARLDCLVEQIIESIRRIEFVHTIRDKKHDQRRKEPGHPLFEPLKAAALFQQEGKYDDAFWLTFLATHFGKHAEDKWSLCAAFYGRLGTGKTWDWETVSANNGELREWVEHNKAELDALPYRFSNHRKYVSLTADGGKGTAAALESYISWILENGNHAELIRNTHKSVGQEPTAAFDSLFGQMDKVRQFGRLGRFDFLTMIGKLGIAPIEPGIPYMKGATGPLPGARLLFQNDPNGTLSPGKLDEMLVELGAELGLGMQVMEDSLCNWQKSPDVFKSFKG